MARRDTYDPFAPPTPPFPENRLRRARVLVASIGHLRDRYEDLSHGQAVKFALSVRQQSDAALRHRFTLPTDLGTLGELTIPALRDLAAAQGVGVSGQKDDLVQRITEAATGQPSEPQGDDAATGDQEGQGATQEPAQQPTDTPDEQPATEPAQEPASDPAPQPDGTGDTITVQTDGDQITGQATDEPVTDDNAGQVEVTRADGTTQTVTGELPADTATEQPATPAETDDVPPAVVGTPEPANVPDVTPAQTPDDAAGDTAEPVATTTTSRAKGTTSRPRSQQ